MGREGVWARLGSIYPFCDALSPSIIDTQKMIFFCVRVLKNKSNTSFLMPALRIYLF